MMKKTVLGKVRGESFLYIVLRLDYKFGSRLLQCFSYNFPIDHLIVSFFYTVSPPHLHLPHVCQTVCVDTCPISTSHKSSYGSCKAEIHYSGWNPLFKHHLYINAARELAAVHLMQRQQLSPKIFLGFLLV